jgi:hypothetical protein
MQAGFKKINKSPMIFKIFILLLSAISILRAQDSFPSQAIVGEWELIGVSAQNKEIPEFKGLIKIYLYENYDYILNTSLDGISNLHKGNWSMDTLDKSRIHLETENFHFQWEIQALESETMVIEDLKDKASLTFRKKSGSIDKERSKEIEGEWFLVEAAGKLFSHPEVDTKRIRLTAGQISANGFSGFSNGKWTLTADATFFMISDTAVHQIFELLYLNANAFVIREGEEVYFFRKKLTSNENIHQLEKKLVGTWMAENPQLPILNAMLLFQKDGTMNGISNLNSELRKWELADNGQTLLLFPYLDNSEEEIYRLRLYMIDKNVMLLSDEGWTAIFKKR